MGDPGQRRDRGPRRPAGWRAPGPPPAGPQGRAELEPAADEDLSYLAGDWRLFQKRAGHRWSMDDLMTAWVAVRDLDAAAPLRALDLGCGLGSVLLLVAWRLPCAEVTGIEAQPERAAMARRSIAYDGVAERCRVVDGDLRELPAELHDFDLVTGTPPYFPRGTGVESPAPGVAPCRFEVRGGVEDYLAVAAARAAPGGRIVMCSSALEQDRVTEAVVELGLVHDEHWVIVPRTGKPPLVMIDRLRRRLPGDPTGAKAPAARAITVRERDGRWSEAFRQVRDDMGMPSQPPGY